MKLFTRYTCFSLLLVVTTCRLWAEGTKEIMPDSTNGTGLIVSTTASFPLGNVGAYLGAPVDDRIYFRIKDWTTESLYFGFNWETLAPSGTIVPYTDVYMNVYNPLGTLINTIHLLGTGAGFISNWSTAVAGPNIGGTNPSGYTPGNFGANMNGDWYVTFYRSVDGGNTHMTGGESMLSKYFDLTVALANGTKYPGRIHCNEWAFSVYNPAKGDIQDPLSPTNAQFYAYTTDSVVTKVYFPKTGFQPLSYIIAVNSFGVQNTGNWINDRKSINLQHLVSPYLTGGYDVFLNVPDPTLYAVCTIPDPPSLVSPTISGCPPGPYNIRFYAPQAGDYYVLLDLNGVSGFQLNSADRFIELVSQVPGVITYVWDGKDGLGNSVPSNTTFPITFSFRKGRINLPFYDVELNINGFSVDAVSPMNALNTTLYWDDSQLTNMGTDCSNNNNNYTGVGYSNAILGQASPGHAWDGNGNSGYIIPAPAVTYSGVRNDSDNVQCNDFGNARLINTWAWGITLNTTQNLTLLCLSVSGTVWDDADGSANGTFSNIRTNSEAGTNAGNTLSASLVDPVTNTVISSAAVNANGTYTLTNCPANATGMKVVISTLTGIVGAAPPPAVIPSTSNWTNTSPLTYPFNTGTTNVTGLDFGVEQYPNSNNQNYTIPAPPVNSFRPLNGFGTIASPGPLAGTDPEDGVMGSSKTVVITQTPSNEQLYYNGVLVTNNTTITNYTPALLSVKFINVSVTSTSFQYAFVDAAGRQDPSPATYTINLSVVLATTMTSFTGKPDANGIVLNWSAANEVNGLYFTVERSADGGNFTAIGRVDGLGNGGSGDHDFTDNSPLSDATGYYRIKLTDISGAVSYSNIIAISLGSGSSAVEVSPNPFRGNISIRLNLQSSGKISLRLLDSKGMLVKQTEYTAVIGENVFQVNGLSSLPVSVYFVQVVMPDRVYVKKIYNQK